MVSNELKYLHQFLNVTNEAEPHKKSKHTFLQTCALLCIVLVKEV